MDWERKWAVWGGVETMVGRVGPSPSAHAKVSRRPPLCHPERTPDFLPRCSQKRPRMRLSLRKAARHSPKPLSLTGNPEEAEWRDLRFHPFVVPHSSFVTDQAVRN